LLAAKEYGKEKITNIVFMGMGEPLINYDNTIKSLQILTDELNKVISRNRITVSTAGIPQRIMELADSGIRIKLAFSLHSCFEDIRTKIMPINKKYPLKENIDALKYYAKQTKTRITFEYTMMKEINDRREDLTALKQLCSSIPSKINLIPFNSIKHMAPDGISAELEPTPFLKIQKFADELRNSNITVMLRDTQGDDIAAACGQLAIKS
ncbi:MAG: radical SAM protein, partial [Ignavibacteriaceae bacterium]|nr:radical SAM protein [Ignavibacteriaceae bacterium]